MPIKSATVVAFVRSIENSPFLSDFLKRHPQECDVYRISTSQTYDAGPPILIQSVMISNILDTIQVHHREWTGGRFKKYSTTKTRVFAGSLPVDLLNEIHKFKGSNTYHLERALRLYVKVMGAKD